MNNALIGRIASGILDFFNAETDDQYAKGEALLFEADRILENPPVKGDDDTTKSSQVAT